MNNAKYVVIACLLLCVWSFAHADLVVVKKGETAADIIHEKCGADVSMADVTGLPRDIVLTKPLKPFTELRFNCPPRTMTVPQQGDALTFVKDQTSMHQWIISDNTFRVLLGIIALFLVGALMIVIRKRRVNELREMAPGTAQATYVTGIRQNQNGADGDRDLKQLREKVRRNVDPPREDPNEANVKPQE